jgi:hypothetical protein
VAELALSSVVAIPDARMEVDRAVDVFGLHKGSRSVLRFVPEPADPGTIAGLSIGWAFKGPVEGIVKRRFSTDSQSLDL